jgi:hypothetical protein
VKLRARSVPVHLRYDDAMSALVLLRTRALQQTRARQIWGLGLALCLLAGCSALQTYPGPARDRSELAYIEPSLLLPGTQILIESLDGKPLGLLHDGAALLPGSHLARVSLVLRGGIGEQKVFRCDLRFVAEAGRRYQVLGELYEAGPRMWIADEQLRTVAEYDAGMLPQVSSAAPRAQKKR